MNVTLSETPRAHRIRLGASLLLMAAFSLAIHVSAATVPPTGYANSFTTQPSAADWATTSVAGGADDTYDTALDVNQNITASGVTAPVSADAGNPPGALGQARWSSSGLYLQTRPTGVRYTALMAKFVNNTGSNATQIRLSCQFTIAESAGLPEESGKGTRVYYSLSGLTGSWTNIPALNTTASANGTAAFAASIAVNWRSGSNLFVVWIDDNTTGSGTDPANQIDDFSLLVTAGAPPDFSSSVTAPLHNAVFVSGTFINAAATTIGGTPPYTVEYFTNSGAGNAVFASAGSIGIAPYNLNLGTLSAATYNIYALATDSSSVPVSIRTATNTFYMANPITFELTAPSNNAIFAHTNTVLGSATVSGGTGPYSVQFYLNNAPNGLAVTSFPYERNFGPLPVGDYTIRASVRDARGWLSNSPVSTIHITGPLAVSLTPANGSSFPLGTSLSMTALVAGGTAPYSAELYVNGQGTALPGSGLFTTNLGLLPLGSYTCYVHAVDSSIMTEHAYSTTNVITITPRPLRVMPVGDSITYGVPVAGGYRAPLYQLLTNAGHAVDFIGTQTANGAPSLPDPNHEGYSGWQIIQVYNMMLSVVNVVVEPDIILLLLGTNDYGAGNDAGATNRLEDLIVRMTTYWPGAKVVVANLTVRGGSVNTRIETTFNPFVPGICDRQRALGRAVYFTDMHSVVPLADMPDQLHPNQLGYNKMATNWFAMIQTLLCSNCPPTFTLHPTNQAVLPGTNVTLTAAAFSASGPVRYQWRFEGVDILNATNATYSFTNAGLANFGYHSVSATDSNGTTISFNAFINVLLRPGFVLPPQPQTVLQGQNATFSAIVTGAPPIYFRWIRGGQNYATSSVPFLVLTNCQSNTTIRLAITNFATGPIGIASTTTTLTVLGDFDRDLMADVWETLHGFTTNDAADALFDLDGDGMINRAEYVAGTNPTDPLSLLKLSMIAGNPAVEFTAQSNIAYTIQYRTNLSFAPWLNLTNIDAQSPGRTMRVDVHDPPSEQRFYRVVAPPLP